MKLVQLRFIKEVNSEYEISLGNGTRHVFSNLKKAKKFLADANKFLTNELYSLNQIYSELQFIERDQWMLSTSKVNDLRRRQNLEAISFVLDKVYYNSTHDTGSMLVFVDIFKAIGFMKRLSKELKTHAVNRRSNPNGVREMDNIYKRLMIINKGIEDYQQLDCQYLFDTPRFNDKLNDIIYLNQSKNAITEDIIKN
jgi:uncharacterized protein (UPF0332 family)